MGRAALLIVVGLAVLYSYLQMGFHQKESQMTEQVVVYGSETRARNIAGAATELALEQLAADYFWETGWTDRPLLGGQADVTIADQSTDSTLELNQRWVTASATYNQRTVNTVALVTLPDSVPTVPGAFGIYTENFNANYGGNSFEIDGHDTRPPSMGGGPGHSGPEPALPGITVPSASAYTEATDFTNGNQADNVKGAHGDFPGHPSVATNPDLTYSALEKYIDSYIATADQTFTGNFTIDGGTLGTPSNPQVTVLDGDGEVAGNTSGAGILVITQDRDVDFAGTFDFEGLVINQGTANWKDAGTVRIYGAVLLTHPDSNQTVNYDLQGNIGLYYSSDALGYAGMSADPIGTVTAQYYE